MATPTAPKFGVKFPSRKERSVKRVTKCETRDIQKRISFLFFFLLNILNTLSLLFKVLNHQNLFLFVHLLNPKHKKNQSRQQHYVNHQDLLAIHHLVLMHVLQQRQPMHLKNQQVLYHVLYKYLMSKN